MLKKLASNIYHNKLIFLIGSLVVLASCGLYSLGLFSDLKDEAILDTSAESYQVRQVLDQQFSANNPSLIILFKNPSGTIEEGEFSNKVNIFLQNIKENHDLTVLASYYSTGAVSLVSNDHHQTYVPVLLNGDKSKQKTAYYDIKNAAQKAGIEIKIGGREAIINDLMQQIEKDLRRSEIISFAILAVLLVFVFRGVAAASVPLLTGLSGILMATALVRLMAQIINISVFSVNVIVFLSLGLAIDYSLFIISRYREERHKADGYQSLQNAIASAGRTVCFSGSIILLSLCGLFFFSAPFLRSVAVGGVVSVLTAVIVSIIILPTILVLFGDHIEWGQIVKARQDKDEGSWSAISHFVIKRAGIILTVVLGLLILLGLPFTKVKLDMTNAYSLPQDMESRLVFEDLVNNFPGAAIQPINILVQISGSVYDEQNIIKLQELQGEILKINGVNKTDSILQYVNMPNNIRTQFESKYISGEYTLINVYPNQENDRALIKELRSIERPAGMFVQVGGATAELEDLINSMKKGLLPAFITIALATIVLLLFMLGSILVPLKAVLLNAISLSAAFGLMTWIFQDGHGSRWLGFQCNGSIEAALPVLIFTIAFGLAMDYEVFLVSRIKERADQGVNTNEAVAYGLQKTGAIITSAALLLLVVIGALGTSKIMTMKQIGVGLGLAVLIDATLVRTLLVPATMKYFGEYNWWLPKRLRYLVDRSGLGH